MGNIKHVKEKEKSVSKPKGGGGAMVVSEGVKKQVKETEKLVSKPLGKAVTVTVSEKTSTRGKEKVVCTRVKESFKSVEHVEVQSSKGVFMQTKVKEGHREKVTKIKESDQLIHKHKARVESKVAPPPVKGKQRLLLK